MTNAKLLTTDETAELINVKPATIRAWVFRDPSFPRVKIGRAVRIPKDQLLDWIARQQPRQLSQPEIVL
jgi:excisionase family DNA binding protein